MLCNNCGFKNDSDSKYCIKCGYTLKPSSKKRVEDVLFVPQKESKKHKFIVATEAGILYKMQQQAPNKVLIPAPSHEDNTCACSECAFMKVNTLQKVYDCLLNETPEIQIPKSIQKKALLPIDRMLQLS